MKKAILLMILAGILFSGCASMYPEKLSSNECLVVIPTGFEKPSTAEFARSYYLGINGHDGQYKIPSKITGRLFIKLSGDDEDIDKINSRVTNSKYSGDPTSIPVEIKLPYAAGQVIVADFTAVQRMVKTKHNAYSSRVDFDETSEAVKEELMIELKNDPNFASWF